MNISNHDAYCIDWYRQLIADGTAEDGQRIAVEMHDQLKELESKNAKLEARLDKAVELPDVKTEQEVFVIHNGEIKRFEFSHWYIRYGKVSGNVYAGKNQLIIFPKNSGKTWFLTPEEAEAALKGGGEE